MQENLLTAGSLPAMNPMGELLAGENWVAAPPQEVHPLRLRSFGLSSPLTQNRRLGTSEHDKPYLPMIGCSETRTFGGL